MAIGECSDEFEHVLQRQARAVVPHGQQRTLCRRLWALGDAQFADLSSRFLLLGWPGSSKELQQRRPLSAGHRRWAPCLSQELFLSYPSCRRSALSCWWPLSGRHHQTAGMRSWPLLSIWRRGYVPTGSLLPFRHRDSSEVQRLRKLSRRQQVSRSMVFLTVDFGRRSGLCSSWVLVLLQNRGLRLWTLCFDRNSCGPYVVSGRGNCSLPVLGLRLGSGQLGPADDGPSKSRGRFWPRGCHWLCGSVAFMAGSSSVGGIHGRSVDLLLHCVFDVSSGFLLSDHWQNFNACFLLVLDLRIFTDRPGFHHCLWGAVRLPLLGHHCVVCNGTTAAGLAIPDTLALSGTWRDGSL
mmetsp:Transcript_56928/g.124467  ORF Transcript_56928/g.124467 Transcript_56928/m.124467 type:complete len:351 (+) Transcript_56928:210-1262(+)